MCSNQQRGCAGAHFHTLTVWATGGRSPALKGSEKHLLPYQPHFRGNRGFKQAQPTRQVAFMLVFYTRNFILPGQYTCRSAPPSLPAWTSGVFGSAFNAPIAFALPDPEKPELQVTWQRTTFTTNAGWIRLITLFYFLITFPYLLSLPPPPQVL